MYQNIPTKVLTGEVRLSYVNLITPRAQNQGDTPKYSVQLLIPKSDTATVQDILQSIEAAAVSAVNEKWGGVRPAIDFKSILHDGDGTKPDAGTPYAPECKGHWVLSATSERKPDVVHVSNINAPLAPNDIYSGMYARVTINFYGYKNRKIGVGCGLGNVLKTRDGEPLSGGASAASDFAGIGQAADTYGAAAPAVPVTPPAAAPGYGAPAGYGYPTAPAPATVQQTAYPVSINPITGMPM
jgi:hypothetical protein